MKKILITLLCGVWLLAGCSGDDLLQGEDNNSSAPLKVSAGPDQRVSEEATVTLSGDAESDSESITYQWSVAPALTIEHADTSVADATFTAPVTREEMLFTLTLTATDSNGNSASDNMTVTVVPVNALPQAHIQVSRYLDYPVNQFPAGVDVILDGTGSQDSDAPEGMAAIANYQWQQTAGPDVLEGESLDSSRIHFTTPLSDDGLTLTFSLQVTDQEGGDNLATVSVDVLSRFDTPPVVDAGVNQHAFSGERIFLTGSATTVVDEANPLTYLWLNDSVLKPAIVSRTSLHTWAVVPVVDADDEATFTIQVTDAYSHVSEDELTVSVMPFPASVINDTGILMAAGAAGISIDANNLYPGQDADRGRDRVDNSGQLNKAGRGDAGFDFSKIDAIGDEVDEDNAAWSCVRDNVTGLLWEVKTDDGGLHDKDHRYSWYQSLANGGYPGDQAGAGATCTLSTCNTSSYVGAMNAVGLCGFYDWRMPTYKELQSILHLGKQASPLIDQTYFPYAQASSGGMWYWTNGSSADGAGGDGAARNAWAISFANGNDNFLNKFTAARVRLVRAGR